jgi:hypothetical protein
MDSDRADSPIQLSCTLPLDDEMKRSVRSVGGTEQPLFDERPTAGIAKKSPAEAGRAE